jgi:transcriptional regulator with XRE-family HTH domain
MDVRRRVGLNVKRFRQERGLSQEEFAFKAGLHRTYISGIERGVRNPTILVLEEIASALGVSSAKLLEQVPRKRARR